jgi:hypothetical protein
MGSVRERRLRFRRRERARIRTVVTVGTPGITRGGNCTEIASNGDGPGRTRVAGHLQIVPAAVRQMAEQVLK